jgi:spore germination protein GerM
MTLPRAAAMVGAVLLVVALGATAFVTRGRWRREPPRPADVPAAPAAAARKIKARLFYVAEDGAGLVAVERDVPFAEGMEQAREIIAAQIAPAATPLVSAVPAGTTLRALFITERGDAYVDLSRDVVTAHPGGTLAERLTVYTVVNALTANLPAIHAVQILVDGKNVPTLAGHVDLRRPLTNDPALVE